MPWPVHAPQLRRRVVSALLFLAASAPSALAETGRPPDAVSLSTFGAVADATTDNHDAIQRALDYAKAHGGSVVVPAGTFAYAGNLTVDGVSMTGLGNASILRALDGEREAIVLTGRGGTLAKLKIAGAGDKRLSSFESAVIWVRDAENATVADVQVSGSSSVGIVVDHSSGVRILRNTVENTLADSIHIVDGSNAITVAGNRILHSGDDGIAVVSYQGKPTVRDVTVERNAVIENRWGRGLSVVGGEDIRIRDNQVKGGQSDYAGIYIAAEKQWDTRGVHRVVVSGNSLEDSGGRSSGHGAITVYNSRTDGTRNDDITISGNVIRDPRAAAILVTGGGAQQITVNGNALYAATQHEMVANRGAQSRVAEQENAFHLAPAQSGASMPPR